jgi:NitT/TauT family transport system substrate-binding protein
MKKILFISIIITCCLTGCKKDASLLRIGYAPIADASQIYIGIDKGYFKEYGLTIQLEDLRNGAKILEALGGKSVDIGLSSYVPFIYSQNAFDFKIISGGAVEDTIHWEHAMIVDKLSGINIPFDLKGKTIAVNGRRTIDHMVLVEYLNKYGIAENDVNITEIDFPKMETVLLAKQVDAICAIEPFVTRSLNDTLLKPLAYHYAELYPEIPIACYVASEKWINKNSKTLEKFIAAFDKATDFYINNPEESRHIISKYTKMKPEEIEKVSLPTFHKKANAENLQTLIDKMYEKGYINKKYKAINLIYTNE